MFDEERVGVAIIGAGPGGLCMGARLREAGFEDFVLLERGEGVGGTWRHNRYPGCGVDTACHTYSFSFARKQDWSRPYASQAELLAYFEGLAVDHRLLERARFGCSVELARWDPRRASWTLRLSGGEQLHARVLVSAVGMFNKPAYPDIPGLSSFTGPCMHTARWDPSCELAGRRVAVIGSAASAVQLVPALVELGARVDLYQRTPNWVMPLDNTPYTPAQLRAFAADPSILEAKRIEMRAQVERFITYDDPKLLAEVEALCVQNLARVEDPELRDRLRPRYPLGAKRPLQSERFFPAFNSGRVQLLSAPIDRIEAGGIHTEDGRFHPAELLALATGFSTTEFASVIDIHGREGRSLREVWAAAGGAQAYLGISVAGFPNFFMLYGPNTNSGVIPPMLEIQVSHVLGLIEHMDDGELATLEVRAEVQTAHDEIVQAALAKIEVWQLGVNNYHRAPSGRNVTQWPFTMATYAELARTPDPTDYHATGPRPLRCAVGS